MAERRMFSKKVIDSDKFLDMPLSAQNVYFHLSMHADDDGFLNNAQKTIRMIGACREDYEILLSCGFIIDFGNGVCVITHWNMNNYIRQDRYKKTMHEEEMKRLIVLNNKAYALDDKYDDKYQKSEMENEASVDVDTETHGIPDGNIMETQYRLGKDSLDKNSTVKFSKEHESNRNDYVKEIIEKWNSIGISKISSIKNNRKKLLNARVAEYGIDVINNAIDNISRSGFLRGQNAKGWMITFDWFIRPNNFIKVLDGNYQDKKTEILKNIGNGDKNKPKLAFCNFPQRDYDYDQLEKKLLGWE